MMIRSMPPASAHLALRPAPAPPPMMGLPAATWARRRCRHCSRVKKLMGGSRLWPDLVRQPSAQALAAGRVNDANAPADFAGTGGVEVAEANDGSVLQTAARKVTIPRANDLIPVAPDVGQLSGDAAKQDGLIRPGQRCEDQ